MLNRLILKVAKFQLPPPKRLGTVVKNILGGPSWPLPKSNRVKPFLQLSSAIFLWHEMSCFCGSVLSWKIVSDPALLGRPFDIERRNTFFWKDWHNYFLEFTCFVMFDNPGWLEDEIKMASPPKKDWPWREQSLKVVYLKQSTFNRWNNLKNYYPIRKIGHNLTTMLLLHLFNYTSSQWAVHMDVWVIDPLLHAAAWSWRRTFTPTTLTDRCREDGDRQWDLRCIHHQ